MHRLRPGPWGPGSWALEVPARAHFDERGKTRANAARGHSDKASHSVLSRKTAAERAAGARAGRGATRGGGRERAPQRQTGLFSASGGRMAQRASWRARYTYQRAVSPEKYWGGGRLEVWPAQGVIELGCLCHAVLAARTPRRHRPPFAGSVYNRGQATAAASAQRARGAVHVKSAATNSSCCLNVWLHG